MKQIAMILCLLLLLTGCVRAPQESTTTQPVITTPGPSQNGGTTVPGTSVDSDSVGVLEKIWGLYGDDDRFAVFGGSMEHAVDGMPGALDLTNSEEIVSKYLLPEAQLANVKEAASLMHMMNGNIFTAAVVTLGDGADGEAVAKAWREAIRQNRWICGQPDKMLMYRIGDHVLMAFGNADAMDVFEAKTVEAFPDGNLLYKEAVVG
jgi:hypothetical protein